jgi:hypothetical protein
MSRPALPTLTVFDRGFRRLSADEQTAFVTDLLAARGWHVERDGRRLVARRDGRSKVVAVGITATEADGIDEVVVGRSGVRRLTAVFTADRPSDRRPRHAGPTVLDTERLYERLRYGLDRDAARTLLDRHFDAELRHSRPRPVGLGGWSPGWVDLAVLVAAVVVLVVGLAGLGGFGGPFAGILSVGDVSSDASRPSLDAASVSTQTPATGPPPGVDGGELQDVDRLVRAHLLAVGDRRNLSMSATFVGPRFLTGFDSFRSGYDAEDRVEIRVRVASETRYHIVRRTDFPSDLGADTASTLERFADGTADYRRVDDGTPTRYDRRPLSTVRPGSAEVRGWTRTLLPRYLNTTQTRATREDDGGLYRIVATGEALGLDHDTRDYRAVAVVTADGFVTDLDVRYVHPRTGLTVHVRVVFDRRSVTVDRPTWYDDARNRTRAVAAVPAVVGGPASPTVPRHTL